MTVGGAKTRYFLLFLDLNPLSVDKKDMSRTNYNGGITTTLATKLCTYLFQLPLQQTPRLQYQISVGAPLH